MCVWRCAMWVRRVLADGKLASKESSSGLVRDLARRDRRRTFSERNGRREARAAKNVLI